MTYKGSYMWKLRQKVGNMLILTSTVTIIPVNDAGEVKLVYASHFDSWSTIGGHVEEGDSWSSAALSELREEGGIIARPEDLVVFGISSGPGRRFHYQDGDTQAFTLLFTIKNWQKEAEEEDKEEVVKSGWFSLGKALNMEITPWARKTLSAYKKYTETGIFQAVDDYDYKNMGLSSR